MWQELIVALAVLAAAIYAAWRLMPGGWRNRLAACAATRLQQAGLLNPAQAGQLQQRLEQASGCGSGGACSSCKGCGAGGNNKPDDFSPL